MSLYYNEATKLRTGTLLLLVVCNGIVQSALVFSTVVKPVRGNKVKEKPQSQKNVPASLRAADVNYVNIEYGGGGKVRQTALVAKIAVERGQAKYLSPPQAQEMRA